MSSLNFEIRKQSCDIILMAGSSRTYTRYIPGISQNLRCHP